jgi:hypothetical protein
VVGFKNHRPQYQSNFKGERAIMKIFLVAGARPNFMKIAPISGSGSHAVQTAKIMVEL